MSPAVFDDFDVVPQGGEGAHDDQDDFGNFEGSHGSQGAAGAFDLDASLSGHSSQAGSLTGSVDLGALTGSQDLQASRTSADSANVLAALPSGNPSTPFMSHKGTDVSQGFPQYQQWQEKHRQAIAAKEAEEKAKHDAILKAGNEERKRLYDERAKRIASNKAKAGTDENGDTSAEGSLWERAAKMVDFNATLAQKDVSRMKEVLIRLKH